MRRRSIIKRGVAYTSGIAVLGSVSTGQVVASSGDPLTQTDSSDTVSEADYEGEIAFEVTGPAETTEQTNEISIGWAAEFEDNSAYATRNYSLVNPRLRFRTADWNNPEPSNIGNTLNEWDDSGPDSSTAGELLILAFDEIWSQFAIGPSPTDVGDILADDGNETPDDRTDGFESTYDNAMAGGVTFNLNHGVSGERPKGEYTHNVTLQADVEYRNTGGPTTIVDPEYDLLQATSYIAIDQV